MAKLEPVEGDRSSRSKRIPRNSSSAARDDWPRTDDSMHDSPPRRKRREEIHRSKPKVPDAPRRHSTSARAPQSLSSSASMRVPNSTMPLLMRSATVSDRRPAKGHFHHDEYDDVYRRGEFRRDTSPPSAHQYRSTPDSRRSSRSSLPPSDDETDPTIESQDEEDTRKSESDVYVVPANRRRRHRRQRSIEEPIIEEPDEEEDQDDNDDNASTHTASLDDGRSPSRHSSDRRVRHEKRERKEYREDREHREQREQRERREHREHRERRERREHPEPRKRREPKEDRDSRKHRHESRRERRRDESVDVEEPERPAPRKRSSKKYYESEAVYTDKTPSSLRPSNNTSGSQVTTAHSVSSTAKRSSTFLGTFFGSSVQAQPSEKPEKTVECVVCMDDLAPRKTAKLKCGHRMCNHCLKRSFKLSVKDPQHMPPKCCSTDNIPLKHVERLFDLEFKKNWNKKFAEYSSRNRIYCPSRRCGEWIKPENIHREDGRKMGKCGRCKTKVCCLCNGKWHTSRECPKDEETNRFLEQAKDEGWQRCYKCKAMVELKEGCNHMTCRCGAEFCMICGAKWKSCECPWFNYEAVENDRLEHMQIPIPARAGDRFEHHGPPSPREYRAGGAAPPTAARPRPQNYDEELYLRRLQEQRDEHLARRLQLDDYDEITDDYTGGYGDIHGIGNSAGHFMNDDYRRRPENIIVPPPPPHQQNPFERANTVTDYVSGVNRARGVGTRATSLERRLADRFNADLRQSPRNSPTHSHHPLMSPHGPPPPPSLQTAATMPTMPIAPVPPPAAPIGAPIGAPIMRRHTMEEDLYNSSPVVWPSERVVPGRIKHDYESEAVLHAPLSRRQHERDPPKQSVMAGLGGPNRGMGRVFEWRTHVKPGAPEGEPITA